MPGVLDSIALPSNLPSPTNLTIQPTHPSALVATKKLILPRQNKSQKSSAVISGFSIKYYGGTSSPCRILSEGYRNFNKERHKCKGFEQFAPLAAQNFPLHLCRFIVWVERVASKTQLIRRFAASLDSGVKPIVVSCLQIDHFRMKCIQIHRTCLQTSGLCKKCKHIGAHLLANLSVLFEMQASLLPIACKLESFLQNASYY